MSNQLTFTYQDYLDNWAEHFGEDETEAEYGYWSCGQHIPTTVKKLSKEEFEQHLKACNETLIAFDIALKANDDPGMDTALARSFPHEIVLLI
jgi:hypothetical protein